MDSFSTPSKRHPRFQPSEHFSERKRALFPSQDNDSDSDLGHMSPLEQSSSPERYEPAQSSPPKAIETRYFNIISELSSPNKKSNLFDVNNENISPIEKYKHDKLINRNMSGLFDRINPSPIKSNGIDILAPSTPSPKESPNKRVDITYVPETPIKSLPTQILKTPHDSNTNLQLPRLIRKSLLDISNMDKSKLKRKSDSPEENSGIKNAKFDNSFNKVSKARTALFTEENIIPAKSFYGKSESSKLDTSFRYEFLFKTKPFLRKPVPVYLCNRKKGKSNKNTFGQINAGVRHKIKKPKRKPVLSKTQLLKAALNIVKNSPLNEYLDQLTTDSIESFKENNECGVSLEQIQKMDSILKSIDTRSVQQSQPLPIQEPIEEVATKEIQPTFGMNMKRPLSPQIDENRKFFKLAPSRATVTISNKIQFKYESGKMSLIEKKIRNPKPIDFDPLDFSYSDEKINETSFTDILKSLEEDKSFEVVEKDDTSMTKLTLVAHNSVVASNNSIQLHSAPIIPQITNKSIINDMLLSPTSLVCDMTSGLALNSPTSQIIKDSQVDLNKLSASKKRITFPDVTTTTMANNTKLFPIFLGQQNNNTTVQKTTMKESKHVKNIRKIWKPLSNDQTLIDAGQKRFGMTQCPECNLVYSLGEPEDEVMHFQHHNSVNVLKYNGWKHERVVNQNHNGRVIQINPTDPKAWWKKVKELLLVINQELGFVDILFDTSNTKVFLYIMNRQIVGCLVAEPKTKGYKMLPSDCGVDQCTEESYPIKCGISRIWVTRTHRKQGVATCLMNVVRSNFIYGHIMSTAEIAFSAPTENGKIFAAKYTKTNSFLIYNS